MNILYIMKESGRCQALLYICEVYEVLLSLFLYILKATIGRRGNKLERHIHKSPSPYWIYKD